jgi:hypothetical protein
MYSPVDLVYSSYVHLYLKPRDCNVQDTVLELEFQGIKKEISMLQVKYNSYVKIELEGLKR